jgi:hypothetical protein
LVQPVGLGANPLSLGLHGVTELHRCLKLMRTTMTFKGPQVITGRTFLDASQEHFGLALRTDYLPQFAHDAAPVPIAPVA